MWARRPLSAAWWVDQVRSAFEIQPIFLDFGKPNADQVFTAVIFGNNRAKFGTP